MNTLRFQAWLDQQQIAYYWRLANERRDHYARAYLVRAFALSRPRRQRLQLINGGCPLV